MMSETGGILRAVGRIGSLTMVSRVLGLARDVVMAAVFGTGAAADAFNLAFRIPNLFRRLFGEGTLNAAFVPVYAERLNRDKDGARYLVSNTLTILFTVLSVLVAAGIVLAPYVLPLIAYGWQSDPARLELSVRLLRILFPYLLFISLALLLGAVLNTHRVFSVPAASPALLNVCWLAGLGAAAYAGLEGESGITVMAWAVLAGGAVQFCVHIPAFLRLGLRYRPVFNLRGPAFREVVTLVLPGVFGMAVTQVNMVVDSLLATFLAGGSVTALILANRLVMLPLGVVGVAMATALLPALSACAARNDTDGMVGAFSDSLDTVLYIMVPVSLFLMVMAVPTIRLVYEHGSFDSASSTPLTAFALLFYAAGLAAYAGQKIVVQAFYALKDTRTPVKVATLTMILNIVLNIAFIYLFRLLRPGFGLGGLALGTAVSSAVNVGILLVWYRKRVAAFRLGERLRRFALFTACGTAAAGGGYAMYQIVGTIAFRVGFAGAVAAYVVAGSIAAGIYIAASYSLKIKELHCFIQAVKRK